MADNTLIFKADTTAAAAAIEKLKQQVAALKEAQAALDAQRKAGEPLTAAQNKQYEEQAAAIRVLNKEIKAEQTALDKQLTVEREAAKATQFYSTSVDGMRKQLALLTRQYDALKESERNAAKGYDLRDKIQALQVDIRKAEEDTGRFQRNVGNYQGLWERISAGMGKAGEAAQMAGKAAANAAGGVVKFSAALANPVMLAISAVIAGIAAAVKGVRDALARSDDQSTKLQASFARLKPLGDGVKKMFEGLAVVVVNIIDGFSKVVSWLGKVGAAMRGTSVEFEAMGKAQEQLVYRMDALEDEERRYAKTAVEAEEAIAIAREKAQDEDISIEERRKALEEAAKLEQERVEQERRMAQERLELRKQEAMLARDTSDAAKTEINDLEIALKQIEVKASATRRRLDKEVKRLDREQRQQEAAAAAEVLRQANERAKAAMEAAKALAEEQRRQAEADAKVLAGLEQARIEDIEDAYAREMAVFEATQRAKIKELEATKTYSEQAEAARVAMIERAEQAISKKRQELTKKRADDYEAAERAKVEATRKAEQERLDLLLAAVAKGTQAELELRLQAIALAEQAELEAKERTEQERLAIEAKYQQQRNAAEKAALDAQMAEATKVIERKLSAAQAAAGANAVKAAEATAEAEQAKLDALVGLSDDAAKVMYGSMEEYNDAILDQTTKTKAAIDNVRAASTQVLGEQLAATSQLAGAVSSVLTELGGDNEEYAEFQFALTAAQIAMDTAKAIAEATSSSMAGDPYTIAIRVAAAVASAVAAMAAATKALNQTKIPKAPKFSQGGDVIGAGSATSDSINAWLSNGESVLTAKATRAYAPLLSAINTSSGGAAISGAGGATGTGYGLKDMAGLIGKEVGRRIANMPAPVVSVVDINAGQQRVQVIDNL